MSKILITGGTIVNEGQQRHADIIIEDDVITNITSPHAVAYTLPFDTVINAEGCFVIPGVIDTHVHFRDPGLTHKADMETESRAAAYGGVTTVFDMPNTIPQTTSAAAMAEKHRIARSKMHVNYTFFPGATNDNLPFLSTLNPRAIPGIKVFMGSSTGNMLVDQAPTLNALFQAAHTMNIPLMAHCEDTATINRNMRQYQATCHTPDPDVRHHPDIRSAEACYTSAAMAVAMARRHNTRLHIAHVSTARELSLLTPGDPLITLEATVAHLLFTQEDYDTLGSLIKCNPAIKSAADRQALRQALTPADGRIHTIGTDHAPHTIEEKQGGAAKAVSGMPMIQYSLVAMLSLVDQKVLTPERLVELMCHNPATLFSVSRRGFLRPGYKADIAIVSRSDSPWQLTKDNIQSKCSWSPLEGSNFHWHVCQTIVNGRLVYDNGHFDDTSRGEAVTFSH